MLILFPGLCTIELQILLRSIWKKVLYKIELETCLHTSHITYLTQQLLCSEKVDRWVWIEGDRERQQRILCIQVFIFQNPLHLFFSNIKTVNRLFVKQQQKSCAKIPNSFLSLLIICLHGDI